MKTLRNWLVYLFGTLLVCALLAGAVFVYAVYAADQAAPTRPLVAIKGTIPEDSGVAGQPLVVFGQASAPDGIAQVELWVNGQQVAAQTNPDEAGLFPFETSQAWIPNGAGNYLILLKAINREGFLGESDPLVVQVYERSFEPDPQSEGEYLVQTGDTLESIAALFGATPEDLLAHNPGLGELTPGASVLVPPPPEGETGGDSASPPADGGGDAIPRVDPPLPAPPPGGEGEPEPAPAPFWTLLPLPEGFPCLINPEICARAIDLESPPFPAPSGVGFAEGDGCSIDVSWTDNSENEDRFRIYRITNRPRFRFDLLQIVAAGPGSGNRLRFRDTSPPRGEFFYAVVAYNAGGDTWSGPSATIESEGCPPSATADQALVVEGLSMNVTESFDRLYCYASLANSPFERIPHAAGSFINLESGAWNIAEHFSGANKREVFAPAAGPLNIVVVCLGWRGEELIHLGRFAGLHLPEEWDGRALTGGPVSGTFTVTYRIQYSFHAADEGGGAAWPLVDPRLPAPFNLHTVSSRAACPPEDTSPSCVGTVLEWDYTPFAGAPRLPTAYKVYRRSPGGSVPAVYHTTATSTRSAPLATDDCHEIVFYSVSAVVGNDPVTGEEIQSLLSDELEVPATCASLEITLGTLWVYEVYDGDPCTHFTDCRNDYEAYGWFSFNGHLIRWNDHCDPGFFEGCSSVGPRYTVARQTTLHEYVNLSLNTGDGYRRNNNVIRFPIRDGEPLQFAFRLKDHDGGSADDFWCGMRTGRAEISLEGRSAQEWLGVDEDVIFDTFTAPGPFGRFGDCIITYHVRGLAH